MIPFLLCSVLSLCKFELLSSTSPWIMRVSWHVFVLSLMHTAAWAKDKGRSWGSAYAALQHVAPYCNTLQYTTPRCITLYHTLYHTAIHCPVHTPYREFELMFSMSDWIMCVYVCLYLCMGKRQSKIAGVCARRKRCNTLHHVATHCNTLQHTTTRSNTLQHAATHCNTLQRTIHCNTLHPYHYAVRAALHGPGPQFKNMDINEPRLKNWIYAYIYEKISLYNHRHIGKVRLVEISGVKGCTHACVYPRLGSLFISLVHWM